MNNTPQSKVKTPTKQTRGKAKVMRLYSYVDKGNCKLSWMCKYNRLQTECLLQPQQIWVEENAAIRMDISVNSVLNGKNKLILKEEDNNILDI